VLELSTFVVCADRVVYGKYMYQGPSRISGPSRLGYVCYISIAEYPCVATGEAKYVSRLDASALPPLSI
jgi:hypothetical protein